MAQSGVEIRAEAIQAFQDIKENKKNIKYAIFKISDCKKYIELVETSPKCPHREEKDMWQEFTDKLPSDDCRYGIFDLHYTKEGGEGNRTNVLFVNYSNDLAPIKKKMLQASSKDAFRKKLNGIGTEIQITDDDEKLFERVMEKARK